MAYPKNATPEEKTQINRRRYLKRREKILIQKHNKYMSLTPEEKTELFEYKKVWHNNKMATDEDYRNRRYWSNRKNSIGKSRRAYCHKCESWKWIDPPAGSLYGGFHYCKLYGVSKFVERKNLCQKLADMVELKKNKK